ncbi:MAG: PCRF domain-containing protein, partial [Acidobacteriota bacterium]|nr:PCRF domain-containing protein [Acidobacteriota bacterium]
MSSSGGFFDVAAGKQELSRIEEQASSPDFWNDQEAAQKLLQKRTILEKKIQRQELFNSQISDAGVLFEFAEEDEESLKELRSLIERVEHEINIAETEMLLGSENDQLNAICTIHPGAGGTESQDWAEMLLRMYLKWAEQRGFKTEILDYQPGEEAGLKGVTFRVEGEYAYGLLSAEAGVHRLVRISPFDQAARRHTSFASLFVYPEVDENIE